MMHQMKPSLTLNSVRTLSLAGLTSNEEGPLLMSRVSAPVLMVTPSDFPEVEPPPRRPSSLPPSGDFLLDISLGDELGHGRSGLVYAVQVNPCSALESFELPPLVAKVCIPNRTQDMTNEASCYDELECLQGVVTPRCYGLFQCRAVVPSLHHHKVRQHEDQLEEENEELEDEFWYDVEQRREAGEVLISKPKYIPITRPEPTLCEDTISVLLLERVGAHVPLGEELPENFEKDLRDMYDDLGRLFIEHRDIRWANVLSTLPVSEGGLPSLPSPFTQRTYNLRIIDFDQSRKRDFGEDQWGLYHRGYCNRIVRGTRGGYVVEYWE